MTALAILLIIAVLGSIIAGLIVGNKNLERKEGHSIRYFFFTWFIIKYFLISFLLFAISFGILELIVKAEFWNYVLLIAYLAINFFYCKNHVQEHWDIWLKPGEGILTPEGRAKIKRMNELDELNKNKSSRSSESKSSGKSCPYSGRVLVNKETKVMGFDWDYKGTLFNITEDWRVIKHDGSKYGWIDEDGYLHEGMILGDIHPEAVLSSDKTALRIWGDCLYHNNDKIGELVSW